MNQGVVVVLDAAAAGVSLVGFVLLLVAVVLIVRRGGWTRAMQPDPQGRQPLPRRLLSLVATFGFLWGVLIFTSAWLSGRFLWGKQAPPRAKAAGRLLSDPDAGEGRERDAGQGAP
jgi:hypothetical protein